MCWGWSVAMTTEWWTMCEGCAVNYKLWTVNFVMRTVNCGLQMRVQIYSIWPPNEQLESLWWCLWDYTPGFTLSKCSQGRSVQFWSSCRFFLSSYGRFWKAKYIKYTSRLSLCALPRFRMRHWWIFKLNRDQVKMIFNMSCIKCNVRLKTTVLSC